MGQQGLRTNIIRRPRLFPSQRDPPSPRHHCQNEERLRVQPAPFPAGPERRLALLALTPRHPVPHCPPLRGVWAARGGAGTIRPPAGGPGAAHPAAGGHLPPDRLDVPLDRGARRQGVPRRAGRAPPPEVHRGGSQVWPVVVPARPLLREHRQGPRRLHCLSEQRGQVGVQRGHVVFHRCAVSAAEPADGRAAGRVGKNPFFKKKASPVGFV